MSPHARALLICVFCLFPTMAAAQFSDGDWATDVNANLSGNLTQKDIQILGGQETQEATKYLESLAPAGEKQDIESEMIPFRNKAARFLKDANAQGAGVTIENAGKNAWLDTKIANPTKEQWLSQHAGKYGLTYRPGVGYVTLARPAATTDGGGGNGSGGGAAALSSFGDALRSLSSLFTSDDPIRGASAPLYRQPETFLSPTSTNISTTTTIQRTATGSRMATTTGTVVTQFSPTVGGNYTDTAALDTINRVATGRPVPIDIVLAQQASAPQHINAPQPTAVTSSTHASNQTYAVLAASDTFPEPTIESVIDEAGKIGAWQKFASSFIDCLKPMQCTASRLQ